MGRVGRFTPATIDRQRVAAVRHLDDLGHRRVCQRFALAGQFDCFMLGGGYTLLRQDSVEFLEYCRAHDIAVLVAAPFNTGVLATGPVAGARFDYRPASAEVLERTARLQAVCARYDVPLAAAALQFPSRHPAVAAVVAGHQSPDEVAANLRLLRLDIPAALWEMSTGVKRDA